MKLFTRVTTLLMVLLLTGGMAWAATYEDHVYVAPSGQGEVLIYPVYMGFEGFQTKLQVINTSLTWSAVAKVVIRSPLYSIETRDFLIFLSPTDVWEGWLMWDGSQVIVYTDDDSMLVAVELVDGDLEPVFASTDDPFSIHLEDPGCGDTTLWGYAEVFLAHVFDLGGPRVSKDDIFEAYIGTGDIDAPSPDGGFSPLGVKEEYGTGANILAGNLQIQSPILSWSSALNAVALADYGIDEALNPADDTSFGQGTSNNSIWEVEAALSKQFVGMPYINDAEGNSLHFFTFPTKLTDLDGECDFVQSEFAGYGRYEGFRLVDDEDKGVEFRVRQMDMTERTPVGDQPIFSPRPKDPKFYLMEMDFIMPQAFSKGWYRYTFVENSTSGETYPDELPLHYTGAPVIPVVMNFGAAGFSLMYGNWTDGTVCDVSADGDAVCFDGYQNVYSYAFSVPQAS